MTAAVDLFEAQVDIEVEKRVKAEVEARLSDTTFLQQMVGELLEKNRQLQPIVEKYKRFLNTDGFLNVAQAADVVEIQYVSPDGKRRIMGQNYLMRVLEQDEIIVSTAGGYRLHSRRKDQLSGKAVTKVSTQNERVFTSVLFTAEGIDWLKDRYAADSRKWRSTTDHKVHHV